MQTRIKASFLATVAVATMTAAAGAQVPPPQDESGIWIADDAGSLREVQPASRTFLRQDDSAVEMPTLLFSVETFAGSATAALADGRLAITRIRQAISAAGVTADDFSYELVYVEPRYRRKLLAGTWEKPRRLGFDAAYVLTVRPPNPSRMGLLIDLATGAGATGVIRVEPATGSSQQ